MREPVGDDDDDDCKSQISVAYAVQCTILMICLFHRYGPWTGHPRSIKW